jgi:two-component system sensor histidine kinase TctE
VKPPLRWLQRASLWQRLALLLFPALLLVTGIELWMTRHDALAAANAAYDRSLLGALKSIDANISTASGGLSVELPYTMFEFFELTASGQVFFRVATSDGLVELGSADLPAPPTELAMGVPAFYDATYFGEAVRLAAYRRDLERAPAGSTGRSVLIQVGESTRSRQEFSARFVRSAALRDGLVLAMLLCGTAIALAAALRPLSRLAREVQARTSDDLTRIADHDLPAEVRPLVAAVNQQMSRTQELVTQQRQFLDDASHQLRTHLTTLQMQADYARREQDPAQVQVALDALGTEIGRATRSAQQLLALGRSDTVAVEPAAFDMAALLREVALDLLPLARAKRIDLGIGHRPARSFTDARAPCRRRPRPAARGPGQPRGQRHRVHAGRGNDHALRGSRRRGLEPERRGRRPRPERRRARRAGPALQARRARGQGRLRARAGHCALHRAAPPGRAAAGGARRRAGAACDHLVAPSAHAGCHLKHPPPCPRPPPAATHCARLLRC